MAKEEGSANPNAEPGFLVIGRLLRPHGIRGEMRAAVYTQLPERFTWLERVFVARDANDPAPKPVAVRSVRFHKGSVLLRLGEFNDRDELEVLRGMWLLVPVAEAIPLDEDEVYHHDLEGLSVFTDEGEALGTIVEILETGANEVFVVSGRRGEVLIPNIEEVVLKVDLEERSMLVHILPGLLA
ncbi:MAG TPA: ribosome maturation factor RimM [Candidatus Binatia bacterium]|jgi:16S rRNA processing protein RimM|nr:ribosome maturation factor RimM [Candidatus Binatia bacterium]